MNVLKPTKDDPTPLDDRFQHVSALDKRDIALRTEGITGISREQFAVRLRMLRMATVKWGSARVESIFVGLLSAKYPDLKVKGRKIASSADFCEWIKQGPWDNKMREIVAYASGDMWGDNNQWAINLEQQYFSMLHVKTSGKKCNNTRAKKAHKGRCACAVFVKVKGSLVGKFRNTCKRRYKEAVYNRTEKPNIQASSSANNEAPPDDEENDSLEETSAGSTGGASSKKKKRNTIPKLLVQVDAELDSHGFHGYIGKCEGHPDLKAKKPVSMVVDGADTDAASTFSPITASVSTGANSSSKKTKMTEAEEWLSRQKGIKTLEDVYGALLQRQQLIQTPTKNGGTTGTPAETTEKDDVSIHYYGVVLLHYLKLLANSLSDATGAHTGYIPSNIGRRRNGSIQRTIGRRRYRSIPRNIGRRRYGSIQRNNRGKRRSATDTIQESLYS